MRHKYRGQQGEKDCAVSCLYNIIRHYKGYISMEKLRDMLNTDNNGTSIYDITLVSNKLGLISDAYKCEINDLCSLKLPVIAHIKVDKKYEHYVIIDKIKDDKLFVFDPIRGYINYDFDLFMEEWSNIIITFDKGENIVYEKENKKITKLFLLSKKNSKYVIVFIFLSLFSSLFSVLDASYLKYLYNNSFKAFDVLIIFVLVSVLRVIIDYLRNITILKYNKKIDIFLTKKIYSKILSLPSLYHHNRPVGDIVARFNDLSSIKEFINAMSFSFIIDLMYILIICTILFFINKTIFLLLVIMIIVYILIYLIFRSNIKYKSMICKEDNSIVNSYLVESIIGIDTIKNLSIEDDIKHSFYKKYNNLLNNNISLNKIILNFNIIQEFIFSIMSIFILFLGINFVKRKILSLSILFIINTLVIYLSTSIKNIISFDNLIIEAKNSYNRLNALNKQLFNDGFKTNIKFKDSIKFKKLKYSYNNLNYILKDINFSINKNDKVFIKGKSGSGKSTIFKLLTKQLILSDNMIEFDGVDINKISIQDINDNICYVSQNEFIFTDSILNNIKLFKEAKKEELDKVIEVTGIDKILKERNITLNFLLEENGHNLSGGERQRIILARSLLRNKEILVLDETMNELDIMSEREIIKKINTEYNKTLILISHRYDNSDLFNKIIIVDGGLNEEVKC